MTEKLTRPQAIALAREMHEGGWGIKEIRDYLAARDSTHDVIWETVKSWADPEWAERRRVQQRDAKRRSWRRRNNPTAFRVLDQQAREMLTAALDEPLERKMTPDLMLALRVEDGLSYNAIAVIAKRFFGEDIREDQVRYRLYQLGAPKNPNKVRLATESNSGRRAAA